MQTGVSSTFGRRGSSPELHPALASLPRESSYYKSSTINNCNELFVSIESNLSNHGTCCPFFAEFTPSPIDLAPFAEGENHQQQLVDRFLHTAYPRAPTAVPQNEAWKASVHTGKLQAAPLGAEPCR